MNRLRDYIGFAVCFAGLGYMAIWPLSASGTSGALFGASIICRAHTAFNPLPLLCGLPHPLILSPALHMLGLVSAIVVVVRLPCGVLRRRYRARANDADVHRRIRDLAASMPAPRSASSRPLPRVKPRSHFGLRGVEHTR